MAKKQTVIEAGEPGHETFLAWDGVEGCYYHFDCEGDMAEYFSGNHEVTVMKVAFKPTHRVQILPPVPKRSKLVAL